MVAVIRHAPRHLRAETTSKALQKLRIAEIPLSFKAPSSASAGTRFSARHLANMNKTQLRSLACKTSNVVAKKKNEQGLWVWKTRGEIEAALQGVVRP